MDRGSASASSPDAPLPMALSDVPMPMASGSNLVTVSHAGKLDGGSYVGIVRLCGTLRSDVGRNWLLYGKGPFLHDDIDITYGWYSNSLKDVSTVESNVLLKDDSGAHNMFLLDDDVTHLRLLDVLPSGYECVAFGIGGQYLCCVSIFSQL